MAANKRFNDPVSSQGVKDVKFGSDVRKISDSIIGFINRDEQITSILPVPRYVNSLGRDFMQLVNEGLKEAPFQNKAWFNATCHAAGQPEAVPGIMTLEFTPVFSDMDDEGFSVTHQSYLAKWMASRNLDNMTKNWQPGDMHWVDLTLGLIKMYLSVAKRALIIMRDVAYNPRNKYYNRVAMLKAMGFNFTEVDVTTHFDSMWSYYNKAIISFINANAWLQYSYPGINRWASLCEAMYRDNPAKTTYAQLYVFMPSYMAKYSEVYDESVPPKKVGWQIDWRRAAETDERPQSWRDRYFITSPNIEKDARGSNGFMRFLNDVHDLLTSVFYNDDVKDIIATLNAIAARNLGNELSNSERFNFSRAEWVDEQSNEAPVVYDSNMLVAIHNATILPNLETSECYVDPKTGASRQTLSIVTTPFSKTAAGDSPFSMSNGHLADLTFFMPKIINMPNMNPTQSDLINATQWTVSLSGMGLVGGAATGREVPSAYVGSDFIHKCYITTMSVVPQVGAEYEVIATDLTDPNSFEVYEYQGAIGLFSMKSDGDSYRSNYPTEAPEMLSALSIERFSLAQQFAMAPMPYAFYYRASSDSTHPLIIPAGPIIQSEVYFVANGAQLGAFHSQWKANFWGYPIFLEGGEGAPNLTLQSSESSFNRNPDENP